MAIMRRCLLALLLTAVTQSFLVPAPLRQSGCNSRSIRKLYMSEEGAAEAAPVEPPKKSSFKGFGEKPVKKAPPPKTRAQLEREKYAKAYDNLAQTGVPEYAVYIREAAVASDKEWKFVGSMAVPRNVKIDDAIYDNEVNLVKGAYKLHPKLVGKEKEGFVYGYNLKKFPDEPIKLAVKGSGGGKNPVFQWLGNVMNPLDASNIRQ